MVNKKIVAQVKFILCFHSAFWQKHFQWFLSAPKWMDNMPSNNRIGGCHAPEMVRRLIIIMRELISYRSKARLILTRGLLIGKLLLLLSPAQRTGGSWCCRLRLRGSSSA